jgi:hypothetical protein
VPENSEMLSSPFGILLFIITILCVILLGIGIIRIPSLSFEYWLAILILIVASGLLLLWRFKKSEHRRKESRTLFDLKYGTSGFPKIDPQLISKLEDQLKELEGKLYGGVITQEEYDERKRKLLDQYT